MKRKILILDLDLTVYAHEAYFEDLHEAHVLSEQLIPVKMFGLDISYNVQIINPTELSELVELACTKYDGIMILTAGSWEELSVKSLLKEHLDVSPTAREKIDIAEFLSPDTQDMYMNMGFKAIQELPKNQRLEAHQKQKPELKDVHFVALDDDEDHIKSYATMTNVTPVLATTFDERKDFYQEAHNALAAPVLPLSPVKANIPRSPIKTRSVSKKLFPGTENSGKTTTSTTSATSSLKRKHDAEEKKDVQHPEEAAIENTEAIDSEKDSTSITMSASLKKSRNEAQKTIPVSAVLSAALTIIAPSENLLFDDEADQSLLATSLFADETEQELPVFEFVSAVVAEESPANKPEPTKEDDNLDEIDFDAYLTPLERLAFGMTDFAQPQQTSTNYPGTFFTTPDQTINSLGAKTEQAIELDEPDFDWF